MLLIMLSESLSSIVTSDFNIDNYKSVGPMKTPKQNKECQCWKIIEQNTDCEAYGCQKWGRNFLQPTWLAKHIQMFSVKEQQLKTSDSRYKLKKLFVVLQTEKACWKPPHLD